MVNGAAGAIRGDYETTDDVAELAQWIVDDDNGLGFMGIGNYLAADESARDFIANVDIEGVSPSPADVQAGRYEHFTRPLLLHVAVGVLSEQHVL